MGSLSHRCPTSHARLPVPCSAAAAPACLGSPCTLLDTLQNTAIGTSAMHGPLTNQAVSDAAPALNFRTGSGYAYQLTKITLPIKDFCPAAGCAFTLTLWTANNDGAYMAPGAAVSPAVSQSFPAQKYAATAAFATVDFNLSPPWRLSGNTAYAIFVSTATSAQVYDVSYVRAGSASSPSASGLFQGQPSWAPGLIALCVWPNNPSYTGTFCGNSGIPGGGTGLWFYKLTGTE